MWCFFESLWELLHLLTWGDYDALDSEDDVGILWIVGDYGDCLALTAGLATGIESDMDGGGLTLGEDRLLWRYGRATARGLDLTDDEVGLARVGDNEIALGLCALLNLAEIVVTLVDFEDRGVLVLDIGEILLNAGTEGDLVLVLPLAIEDNVDAVGDVAPIVLLLGIVGCDEESFLSGLDGGGLRLNRDVGGDIDESGRHGDRGGVDNLQLGLLDLLGEDFGEGDMLVLQAEAVHYDGVLVFDGLGTLEDLARDAQNGCRRLGIAVNSDGLVEDTRAVGRIESHLNLSILSATERLARPLWGCATAGGVDLGDDEGCGTCIGIFEDERYGAILLLDFAEVVRLGLKLNCRLLCKGHYAEKSSNGKSKYFPHD